MLLGVDWDGHARELAWVAGGIVSLAVIGKYIVQPIWRFIVKFKAWMDRLEAVMKAVESQLLKNNGGSTLKDKIEETHAFAKSLDERLKRLEKKE